MATKMKIKKMDNGGPIGRSISQKAATRKTLKDKGYIVGSDSKGNKGSYVPYSKNQKNSTSSPDNVGDALSQSKTPRPIKKVGGAIKPKMMAGGVKMKKYETGGVSDFEERQRRKKERARTKAEIAAIEGEGTVSNKRNNRADRIAVATGTKREKVPKSLSTSTTTSTSNTDNRNSGNTYNTTSSGSSSGSTSGANAGANADANSSSTINPMPRRNPRPIVTRPRQELRRGASMQKGGSTKAIKPKMKVGGSTTKLKKAMYGSTMKPTMMKKGGTKKK